MLNKIFRSGNGTQYRIVDEGSRRSDGHISISYRVEYKPPRARKFRKTSASILSVEGAYNLLESMAAEDGGLLNPGGDA